MLYAGTLIVKPMSGALPNKTLQRMVFFTNLTTILDLLSWITILLKFFNGYIITHTKTVILEPKRIAWHYISRPHFACDVLSSIPIFPVMHLLKIAYGTHVLVINGVLFALCELKLVRLVSYLQIHARERIFLLMCVLVMTFTVHNCALLQLMVPKLVRVYFAKENQENHTWYSNKITIRLDMYKMDDEVEDYILAILTYIVGKALICITYDQ
ncbi:unnamed protein product [Callosobruchus maculatus]|uniref:Ion transport domain-containing protein n=1 Tax=Callosobruchus maculatus TaxID=64391 RepID=A0A653DSR4_CALMS|nr:unnamed protein product [Callosobruchus maculatus]